METDKKTVEEQQILQEIFSEDDYQFFLETINGKEEKIEQISNIPIDNYAHNESALIDKELLSKVYKPIKFYLEQNNFYLPKMQEGIAMCASKIAILKHYQASYLETYVKGSYFFRKGTISNPFEELVKLLLLSLKNESIENNFKSKLPGNYKRGTLSNDSKLYCDVLSQSLNINKFYELVHSNTRENIIEDIGISLEESNITSENPMSACSKENEAVISNQLERIESLHNQKLENEILVGAITSENYYQKLITNFTNAIIYTKRNIGVYEKTKRLSD